MCVFSLGGDGMEIVYQEIIFLSLGQFCSRSFSRFEGICKLKVEELSHQVVI